MAEQPQPDREGWLERDDQRVHWEYFGAGGREVIVLCNGLAMHTAAWYGFLPLMRDEYDVLLWDFLGQGESSSEDTPYTIPWHADALEGILDELGLEKVHLMGISYGGFVALDFARLHQDRLDTLTVSGILLSHERLFQMYQELSLEFYRGDERVFEIYTLYMYEKIFSERFVQIIGDKLDAMRKRFYDRYFDRTHCLIRLTEAQNPFFASLDDNMPGYRAIQTPTLILTGAQDRAIPPWVQQKLCDILPNHRYEEIPDCGHVVYLEASERFFGDLKKLAARKALDF